MGIEEWARSVLEKEFGYKAEKIPECSAKSPDFFAEGFGERFIVEFKIKEDDRKTIEVYEATLKTGEIAEHIDTTGRKNTISKIVADSHAQLKNCSKACDFKLVWLMAVGRHQDMKKDQFIGTLYGQCTIFDLDDTNTIPCYYFHLNDFFRVKGQIDGAIVATEKNANLCLNSLSPNYTAIRDSHLAKIFGRACIDPVLEEQREEAMVLDADLDRNDTAAKLMYLREKYNRDKIQDMQPSYYSSSILLPSA